MANWLKGEKGSIGSAFAVVFCIGVGVVILFVIPLMTMANKQDQAIVQQVQVATSEFVDNAITTKTLTQEDYDNFLLTLTSTGYSYDVEITIYVPDENPSKKQTSATQSIDGYYIIYYTSQVLEQLPLSLAEGSIISVTVQDTSISLGEQLANALYSLLGSDSATYVASESGMVQ